MRETYRAIPCPCGHPVCKNWLVDPVAAVQCVRFTEEQARAVADLLNNMEPPDESDVPNDFNDAWARGEQP